MNEHDLPISLSGDPLDRCDALRKQDGAVEKLLLADDALILVLCGDEILLDDQNQLLLVSPAILSQLQLIDPETIFLGVEHKSRRPWFVISLDTQGQAGRELVGAMGEFVPIRQALQHLPAGDLAITGRSISLFSWHASHRFCAGCGQATISSSGGEKRVCSHCETEHFPRVDPAVIMLVTHGDQCLLGRNASWPPGMYSTLAGFVEPGESFEEACRREVMEESGIQIGKVSYGFSQPWPFPHSVMIGLVAEALSTEITVEDELEDARWFSRDEILSMLEGTHDTYTRPYPQAASGVLIANWANGKPN
jgi:NAD+ diphosphatase